MQGMMSSQNQDLIENGSFKKFTIIHIKEFVCNEVNNKRASASPRTLRYREAET